MPTIPPTSKRVELNTDPCVNQRINEQTIAHLKHYRHADEASLSERLRALNKEWDTERVLEANASVLIFISTILGYSVSRYWFLLTAVISLFLLQHAVQGWCPPLPFIRKLGIRTAAEIGAEKTVIKVLRGDFSETGRRPEDLFVKATKE